MKALLDEGGPSDKYMFGAVDKEETRKGQDKNKRIEKIQIRSRDDLSDQFVQLEGCDNYIENDNSSDFKKKLPFNYNTLKLPTVAMEADRGHGSDTFVASIVNATLIDLGLLTKDNQDIVVTRHKIRTARKIKREEMRKKNREENIGQISCLGFDGKKTQTLTVTEEKKRRNMVQDHYTFTNSAGKYLDHATITAASTGKNIAVMILEVLDKYESRDTLKALACDGTVTNTGRISGAMFLVEKEIQRNVHWLVCLLHMNELHLRNVLLIYKTKKIILLKNCFHSLA